MRDNRLHSPAPQMRTISYAATRSRAEKTRRIGLYARRHDVAISDALIDQQRLRVGIDDLATHEIRLNILLHQLE
jgi:hypothetical protein